MDSDSDNETGSRKATTTWNKLKLGVATASKSIFKTPAQDRLAKLRTRLLEEQKKSHTRTEKLMQTLSSDNVQKNGLGGVKLLEKSKLKSGTNNVQARLNACLKKPSSEVRVALVPPTEICNQLSSLKPSNYSDFIASPPKETEKTKKDIACCPSLLASKDENENRSKILNKIGSPRKYKSIKIKPELQSPVVPAVETKKSRKRKPVDTETSIEEKVRRHSSEVKPLQIEDGNVQIKRHSPEAKPLQIEVGNVLKKFSANDRLQRLREVLKKQKVKKPKDKPRDETPENNASEPKAMSPFKFPKDPWGVNAATESPVEQMDVDIDPPTFAEPQKTEHAPSTSFSSNIAAFFQSFRKEIANAFSHNENINIKEQYNKTINKIQSEGEISEQDCVYVIPDTNIFIHHLTFIKDAVKYPIKDNKTIRIYVPYIVIEELDRLKEKTDKAVSTTAMRAVKYLNKKLEKRDVSLCGQTIADSMDYIIPVKYPDDSILNCCFQMKRKGNKFLLLSNDINLRNKALVNGMKALASPDVDLNDIGLLLS